MASKEGKRIKQAYARRRHLLERLGRSSELAGGFRDPEDIDKMTEEVVGGIRDRQRRRRQTVMISAS